jgi:Omp85 superfamily domain
MQAVGRGLRNAFRVLVIRCTLLFALLATVTCGQQPDIPTATPVALNANSRYIIEGVHYPTKVGAQLREELNRLVGERYDEQAVKQLAQRMRRELHASAVTHRLERGDEQDHVKLFFESRGRRFEQAADVTKLAYHSKQGLTGGLEAGTDIHQLHVGFGVQSDADTLLERYAGINANVSRVIAERVRLRFDFEDYHEIWNRTTRLAEADSSDGIYRERRAFRPTVSVEVAPGLVYTAGVDLEHMEFQFPAVRTLAANSVINTLRLRRKWGYSGSLMQVVDAGYSLRAATKVLDSDFVYARHFADARYTLHIGENHLTLRAAGGSISGSAPLFERFAPGNSSTLRGWNKFDISPIGSSRMAVGSVEYRYDNFLVFYDVGSAWDAGEPRVVRHGTGAGFGGHGWYIAVAFPIRSNGVQPVFLVGTAF